MSVFGGFVYGSGTLYGSEIDLVIIEPISTRMVYIEFTDEVVVDENYTNTDNYSIEVVEGSGPVRVNRVLPINGNTTKQIILVTDNLTHGTHYRAEILAITGRDGRVAAGSGDFYARFTKTDSILRSLPNHFDKRPESKIASLMTSISMEDEKIGGSKHDQFVYSSVVVEGRLPVPSVAFDLDTPGVISAAEPPKGTFENVTTLGIFVDEIFAGYATLDQVNSTWTLAFPAALLTDGVPVELRVSAVGPGGVFSVTETVTPDIP